MDPKFIANIPISVVAVVFVGELNGFFHLDPYILFSSILFFGLSLIFKFASSVMGWSYKSNLNTDKTGKRLTRDVLIPITLLLPFFFIPVSLIYWEDTHSTNSWEFVGTVLLCTMLAYLNGKFSNKVFAYFTPQEKDTPIKFVELRKYIRWYTWLLLAIIFLIAVITIARMLDVI